MATFEQRVRRTLRWYPRQWRQEHGDVVVGTLLDAAEGGAGNQRSELFGLAVHGVAQRLAFFTDPRARAGAATLCLATGSAYALVQAIATGSASVGSRGIPHTGLQVAVSAPSAGVLLAALWAVALCCGFLGLHRGRAVALAAVVAAAAAIAVLQVIAPFAAAISLYALLFQAATAAVALVGRPRSQSLLIGLTIAWAGVFAFVISSRGLYLTPASSGLWASGPLDAAGLTLLLTVVALVAAAFINTRLPRHAAALLLGASPWGAVLVTELLTNPGDSFEYPFPLYSVGLLVLCAGALVALHLRQRRRGGATPHRAVSTPDS